MRPRGPREARVVGTGAFYPFSLEADALVDRTKSPRSTNCERPTPLERLVEWYEITREVERNGGVLIREDGPRIRGMNSQ